MRNFYVFILVFFSVFLKAQITISEVYYDTPVNERLDETLYAHAGEFIELFNYSKEDIDISGWVLSDNASAFTIPNNTILKSGKFLIFRRDIPNNTQNDYFFSMFNEVNQQEHERSLFSSRRFLLNNYSDFVKLRTRKINGKSLDKYYTISFIGWGCRDIQSDYILCDRNYYRDAINSNGINYNKNYYVKSFQKNNENIQLINYQVQNDLDFRRATPFELGFQFELVDLSEVENYNTILYNNYCSVVDWQGSVNNTLNTICDNDVSIITEPIFDFDIQSSKCFNFDEAGNQVSNYNCTNNGEPDPGNGSDDNEDLSNHFYLAPNPTNDFTTLSWDQEVHNLITTITIIPINGAYEIPVQVSPSTNSVLVNMTTYPFGIYIVQFHLNTGGVVTKHLIKQ
ncbi:MAG: lamin tail domain-containing protein [Weeksellaceae bacterium]